MNLLPYQNLTFRSKLKSVEVIERLLAVTEAEKLLRMPIFNHEETKLYEGQVTDQNFSIHRLIKYRNSFLPRIKGEIIPESSATRINVKMRLHIVIVIFAIFWCIMVGTACFVFVLISIRDGKLNPFIFIPIMILLFGYGVTVAAFNYECKKSKIDLEQIFGAEGVE